ncbi:radical SAM/SPASM domain-containing protein [Clostridium pasteurianum]|uniref:radical SAM/SPASM domain-containing protein n=1 Tax=Clostridium pasteurianum TaxID=1501 RepID=UPI001FA76775|nr:radical SAM protein [Clostridium pasteurianum]
MLHKIDICIPDSLREICIQFAKNIASNYPTESKELKIPSRVSTLYIVLTSKCNSNCLYCFRDLDGSSVSLNKNYIMEIISSFKEISNKNPSIVYTGGEPCLFPDLIEIANYSKEMNIKNTLQTNGTLINKDNASLYASTFDTIQMSLDSTNEEMNDWLRGKKGHFKAVSDAVTLLLKYNVKVRLAATVTKKNFYDILNIKKTFPDVGFQFTPMLQIGKGRNLASLAFSPEEFIEYIADLPSSDKSSILSIGNVLKFGEKNHICGAGTSILSVSPDGDVYPCQMLHHSNFCCGNVRNDSLESIYHTSEILNKFRNLKIDMIDGCKDCDIRHICGGGCRANSFWLNNEVLGEDYFCEYNKQIYFYNLINMFKEVNIEKLESNRT